jgi:hypothetical protein
MPYLTLIRLAIWLVTNPNLWPYLHILTFQPIYPSLQFIFSAQCKYTHPSSPIKPSSSAFSSSFIVSTSFNSFCNKESSYTKNLIFINRRFKVCYNIQVIWGTTLWGLVMIKILIRLQFAFSIKFKICFKHRRTVFTKMQYPSFST